MKLRGYTPFQGVIFYLWTDLDEICTVYIKLNSNSILFANFFLDFGMVFEKIWNFRFFFFCVCVFFQIFKRIEVKTINARRKTKTVLKSTLNSGAKLHKAIFNFRRIYFFTNFFSRYFQRYAFLDL